MPSIGTIGTFSSAPNGPVRRSTPPTLKRLRPLNAWDSKHRLNTKRVTNKIRICRSRPITFMPSIGTIGTTSLALNVPVRSMPPTLKRLRPLNAWDSKHRLNTKTVTNKIQGYRRIQRVFTRMVGTIGTISSAPNAPVRTSTPLMPRRPKPLSA